MFNFNKLKDAVFNKQAVMEDLPGIASKLYPKEVLEIHNEFDTAADKILEEAISIINKSSTIDFSKLHRLKKLGFANTKDVVEQEPIIKKVNLSKEQIELVNYYKRNYPLNKFITEEQVKEICHKYNLVCGDVTRFKGFVPDKNLKEIERFELKNNEKTTLIGSGGFIFENAEIRSGGGYYHIHKINNPDPYIYAFQSSDGITFYGQDSKNIFGYKYDLPTKSNRLLDDSAFATGIVIETNVLKICAPVKDMDISGLELEEGYKLVKKHIPDPVVLQPVKGGYLILTAWGDEASDPIVVNEILN